MRKLIIAAFLLLAATACFAQKPLTDEYGGIYTVQGTPTGYWHAQKLTVNSQVRWVFIDPRGNGAWPITASNFRSASYGADATGKTWPNYWTTKYTGNGRLFPSDGFGSTAINRWSYFERENYKLSGFSGTDTFAYNPTVPLWAGNPTPTFTDIPVGNLARNDGAFYITDGFSGQAMRYGTKNIYGPIYATFSGSLIADFFDPGWATWALSVVNNGSGEDSCALDAPCSYILAVFEDQEDQFRGNDVSQPHLGFIAAATAPYMAYDHNSYYNANQTYPDTDLKVWAKWQLQAFLQAKYGTIAALNASWGTGYTTWGITTRAWTSIVPTTTANAAWAANGSTLSFTGYLIPPHLPITGGTVVFHYTIGGVAHTVTDAVSGNGTLATNSNVCSGSVDLASGLAAVTFCTANPPDSATALNFDFTGGAWDVPGNTTGSGFMDENGTNLGTDWKSGGKILANGTLQAIVPAGAPTALTTCGPMTVAGGTITNCMLVDLETFAGTMIRQFFSTLRTDFHTYKPNHMLNTINLTYPRTYMFQGMVPAGGGAPYVDLVEAQSTYPDNLAAYVNVLGGQVPFVSDIPLQSADASEGDLNTGNPQGGWGAVSSISWNDSAKTFTVTCPTCNFWWNSGWSSYPKTMVQMQCPGLPAVWGNLPVNGVPYTQTWWPSSYPTTTSVVLNSYIGGSDYTLVKPLLSACITNGQPIGIESMAMFQNPYDPRTQAQKGQDFYNETFQRFNAKASNGDYPVAGALWWDLTDDTSATHGEEAEYGFVSTRDNLKDGIQDVPGFTTDSAGFTVGGDTNAYGSNSPYGDFIPWIKAATDGASGLLASEFSTGAVPSTANVAANTGAVASCDADQIMSPASMVTDEIYSTAWHSCANDASWIYVDLGHTYTISKVTIEWAPQNYGVTYALQTSTDASTWTTVKSVTGGAGGADTEIFTPTTTRYVRMAGTLSSTANSGYEVLELQAFGTPTLPPGTVAPATSLIATAQ